MERETQDLLREIVQQSKASTEAALSAAKAATRAADRVGVLEAKIGANAETSKELHRRTLHALDGFREELDTLRARIDGSTPPPPDAPPVATVARSAEERATGAGHELAALEGRMVVGFASLEKKLTEQDKALGVGRRGAALLLSPPVLRTLPAVIAAVAALVAAMRTAPGPAAHDPHEGLSLGDARRLAPSSRPVVP